MFGQSILLRFTVFFGLLFSGAPLYSQIYVDTLVELNPVYSPLPEPLWTKHLHHRIINCMALSADGSKLLTGGATGIKILTLSDTGFHINHAFRPFKSNYSNVTWSPDNKKYFIGSYGGFHVYNTANNSLHYSYAFPAADNWVQDVFVNSKNQWLITDWHSKARIYSLTQNKIIKKFTDTPESSGFARGMSHLSASLKAFLGDSIKIPEMGWDRGATTSMIIDTIARLFIFTVNQNTSNYICLWNYQSGKFAKVFSLPPNSYLSCFRLNRLSDGNLNLYYSYDKFLYSIDLRRNTTKLLYKLPFPDQLINSITIDSKNGYILLGTEDRSEVNKPYLICLKNPVSVKD